MVYAPHFAYVESISAGSHQRSYCEQRALRCRIDLSSPLANGIVLLLFGVILVAIGSKQLTKTDLHGIKSIPEEIIAKGLYGIIRHPVNLGFMFTFAGWYIVWSGVYSLYFLAVFIIVFVFETFWEERNLGKAFGDR